MMMMQTVESPGIRRHGERGSAMVMVLLLAILMLVASVGVVLEATMGSAKVSDSTSEQQAYNAAESGIQSALHVLRGNAVPSPLLNTTLPAEAVENQISLRRAVERSTSNYTGDPLTNSRLSRWIKYNYTSSGSAAPDRVALGQGTYSPATGTAYTIDVRDPDNTGSQVTYSTSCKIQGGTAVGTTGSRILVGSTKDGVTFNCNGAASRTIDTASGLVATDLGSWTVTNAGRGDKIDKNIRFFITINMTAPYLATKVLGGVIEKGDVKKDRLPTILYDTEYFLVSGTPFTLRNGTFFSDFSKKPARIGYIVQPTVPDAGGFTSIASWVGPPEPLRVVVTSTGYGPRGAKKVLEAVVQNNYFNNASIPATILLIGGSGGFVFKPGKEGDMTYSGKDAVSGVVIPAVGVTNDTNLATVDAAMEAFPGNIVGFDDNVTDGLPTWLATPTNLYYTLESLKAIAKASGGYYGPGKLPKKLGNYDSTKGITYIDTDANISGRGGGILICTGKLSLKGRAAVDFKGIIIVTGSEGIFHDDADKTVILGNIIVAPFNMSNPAAGWLTPKLNFEKAGKRSTYQYSSSTMSLGNLGVGNVALGITDK